MWSDAEIVCLLVLVGVIALVHLLTFLAGARRP
jgi:EamA domain-containing membrane protein RarD